MFKLKEIKTKKPHNVDKLSSTEGQLSYPPNFYANAKQVPEIEDWKVGEKYILVIEVEMKRLSSYDNGTKTSTDASFDVLAYAIPGEEMSDEDLETMQGEAMTNHPMKK